ncbi:MAG: N-acetylglucosamine-6-phosphate deacetylase [Vicinamibacterales bacterium]
MTRLRGARLVTPDGVRDGLAVTLADGRITEIAPDHGSSAADLDCGGGWLVPGFVDVHVHGVGGIDVLSGGDAVARVAATLPRYGVTAFLPTSVACPPDVLAGFLAAVAAASAAGASGARVLGAHLESNFIAPDYKGAQPARCLRRPPAAGEPLVLEGEFTGAAILATIDRHAAAVRVVTLAPELPHALDLISRLAAAGHRVSLGHSGATYEQGLAGVAAGARHATHLFNRMPPLTHRAPGLAGAVLTATEVTCEVIVDGVHVHPGAIAMAIRAKGPAGIAAITDGTAASGLPVGATTALGEHVLHVRADRAELADGTLAGSVATMDGVFRRLVSDVGLDLVEASRLTSTTPAEAAGRPDLGRLAVDAAADLVWLDDDLRVRRTWVGGRDVWNSGGAVDVSPAEVRR